MLTSIELYGFKSFADRVKIDLDGNICALIGPNGSGKSNVVDAIKWALGEQSAKRLRGDEMTDVIFNGSATRQPLGSAEVTISFDNKKRILPIEADEVHLTRRVYRSGESEYLINGQASRLRDFRDLIGGVGLGAQGYAVIEQGRVEALLQSTSEQRRAVLEDAAGISRFNAKKQEATRRLERVEQNLLRLSDIVNEIEAQLRKTKAQAGKAEIYRKCSTRLQKLRTEVSLYEWRVKTEARRLASLETDDFESFETDVSTKIQTLETETSRLSVEISDTDCGLRGIESELATTREKIAAEESGVEFQIAQIQEWTAESSRGSRNQLAIVTRLAEDADAARKAKEELDEAQGAATRVQTEFDAENEAVEKLAERAETLTAERDKLQSERETKSAETTRFAGELAALTTRKTTLSSSWEQKTRGREELEKRRTELAEKTSRLHTDGEELARRDETSRKRLVELRAKRDELNRELNLRQAELSELERKRAAYGERAALLNDLLCRYEGVSPGVRETLNAMKNPSSPFRNAYGLVADLIRVNVEAAPLVELALGQTAQYVVVPPEPELFRHIERQGSRFAGRVGFIWLDPNPGPPIPLDPKLENHAGVLGRADQFVETEPMFEGLVQRLLRRTWIVESVAVAKQLYRETEEPTNFLAADGSLLSADGTLVVGSAQGSAGLISRRSELASLSSETTKLNEEFETLGATVARLKAELATVESEFEKESAIQRETTQALESLKLQESASQEQGEQLTARREQLEKELAELSGELEEATTRLATLEAERDAFNARLAALEEGIAGAIKRLDDVDRERQERTKRATNLKIELAKAEERILFLQDKLKRLADGRMEQTRLATENENRVKSLDERVEQARLAVLASESKIATLYAAKERLADQATTARRERNVLEKARTEKLCALEKNRAALEKRREAIRSQELARERYAQELKTIEERMREDYGIDVACVEYRLEDDPKDAQANALHASADAALELVVPVDAKSARTRKKEIDELRRRLQELGSVNLEAIETLETLRARYTTLFNQYNDLVAARKSIQKIIERVNSDCRRLFEETFNAVRANFSVIFQKLFGGGKADLALTTPTNPLDSGVEIVARPPGKELRNLSLMSGGEKSLTCVALLLAIFQYRTSPVCILDEVDAALDEANVHRFANSLLDFAPRTQFLVVTHSKKTTTTAKSIYGVTMEDSGVSKILSVHFDDLGEDGEILLRPGAPKLRVADAGNVGA